MTCETNSPSELDNLVESFLERQHRGERPSMQEYIQAHPHLAEQIREVFPALEMLEEFGAAPTGPHASEGMVEEVPTRLGEFRILREVGRGGMGIVYEAVQESLGRHVALKVLPSQARNNQAYLQRFRREAQSAARLHHTSIVPVFSVGEHEGVCYYAMQFIAGQSLAVVLQEIGRLRASSNTNHLRTGSVAHSLINQDFALATVPATTPESATDLQGASTHRGHYFRNVARIGVQVAEALAYAHGQGVIHRDIKPGNLMLDLEGGVWVTDFGLAKLEGSDDLTGTGDILGTLRYTAPEQVCGKADARSDIYSLGITLSEMATLQPAFHDPVKARLVDRILKEEPTPPGKLEPQLPRDLETIILKATAKEPSRRYQSATEMAEDLRRFLADRPVKARRASRFEHAWRWCRRNPAPALLGSGLLLALLAIVLGLIVGSWRLQARYAEVVEEKGKTERALEEQKKAQQREQQTWYFQRVALALHEWRSAKAVRARELLEECPAHLRHWEWHHIHRLCHRGLLSLAHAREVNAVAFSPDGRRLVSGDQEGTVHSWDTQTGKELFRREVGPRRAYVNAVAYNPDGQRLAAATDNLVLVLDAATGKELQKLPTQLLYVTAVAFSADGARLAGGGQSKGKKGEPRALITVWEANSGKPLTQLPLHNLGEKLVLAFPPARLPESKPNVHPGPRYLAAAYGQNLHVWNLDTGKELMAVREAPSPFTSVTLSPDGRWLAAGHANGLVSVWTMHRGRQVHILSGHQGRVRSVAFGRLGGRLASAGEDGTLRVWDVSSGKELFSYNGHAAGVTAVAFSPDGRLLVSGSNDRTVRIWDGRSGPAARRYPATLTEQLPEPGGGEFMRQVVRGASWPRVNFRPRCGLAAIPMFENQFRRPRGDSNFHPLAGNIPLIRLLELSTGKWLGVAPGNAAALSPDGRQLAVVHAPGGSGAARGAGSQGPVSPSRPTLAALPGPARPNRARHQSGVQL